MIPRNLKIFYYLLCSPFMSLNGFIYRHFRKPWKLIDKVHLGPGKRNYLSGWLNLDGNLISARPDIWVNLTDPLPFPDNTIEAIYSHHVIEHLPDADLQFHFNEIFRCLKPKGVFRIGGPNGDSAIRKFSENDLSWFSDFPDKKKSIGGRFVNFVFCRNEHLTLLTFSYLEELAFNSGFLKLFLCKPQTETRFPQKFDQKVLNLENESSPLIPHTIIVEGQKE